MERSGDIVQTDAVHPLASQAFKQCKRTYKDDLNSHSSDLFQPTQSLCMCVYTCVLRRAGGSEVSEMCSLFHFTHPLDFCLGSRGSSRDCLLQCWTNSLLFPSLFPSSTAPQLSKPLLPYPFPHTQTFLFFLHSWLRVVGVCHCVLMPGDRRS